MDWNEDWEEEDPNQVGKGPFDDQLVYGKDGPHFKCGDRIKYIGSWEVLKNKIGTVVNNIDDMLYFVCFDKNIGGIEHVIHHIPDGHGTWVSKNDIRLI